MHHSVQINKPPTLAPRKEDIQELLEMNHVGYKEEITKNELLKIIKTRCLPSKYFIGHIFEEHFHETIRLPPFDCDLNAVEFIWNIIKTTVKVKVKLSLCITKHHAMKTYWEVEV